MLFNDLLYIFYAWAMTFVLQIIAAPFLIVYFKKKLFDAGWAWGRLITWLIGALIIWFVSHIGIPLNTQVGVWVLVFIGFFVSFNFWNKNKKEITGFINKNKKIIILEEGLFLFGFIAISIIRGFHPAIIDLEKFMDAGLMVSYLHSPTLPAADTWLAGESVNYYTFGQFLGSLILRLWSIGIAYGYNLLLGMLFGMLLMQVFSLVGNLIFPFIEKKNKSKKLNLKPVIIAGLVGAFVVMIGSNGHAFWYLLENKGMDGYWYPDATRFINDASHPDPNTIHEIPTYSFVVSDLHAHVWSLPVILLMFMVITLWADSIVNYRSKKYESVFTKYVKYSFVAGTLLGVLAMTSAWDVAISGLLLAILGVILLVTNIKNLIPLMISACVMLITMIFVSSPWWLNFESISQGVRIVEERSPMWKLAVLWLSHVLMSGIALTLALYKYQKVKKEKKSKSKYAYVIMVMAIVLAGWALLIIPEFIYVKDIYPDHPRANTMFKLTFQGFVLMGISIGWLAGYLQLKKNYLHPVIKIMTKILLVVFILSVGYYPYYSYGSYYEGLKNYKGIDGLVWLEDQYPSDYRAIEWLNDNVQGRPNIVEAVGDSYTTFARVSSFTGYPTVLGWRVHEWLWRGGYDIPGARTEEVRLIYETPTDPDVLRLLNQYNVQYVFVGDKEYEAYDGIDVVGLKRLGEVVFADGGTFVVRRFGQY